MPDPKPTLVRRTLLGGAATAGAAAAAAALMPQTPAPVQAAARTEPAADVQVPGYRVTEHVAHYYATARI